MVRSRIEQGLLDVRRRLEHVLQLVVAALAFVFQPRQIQVDLIEIRRVLPAKVDVDGHVLAEIEQFGDRRRALLHADRRADHPVQTFEEQLVVRAGEHLAGDDDGRVHVRRFVVTLANVARGAIRLQPSEIVPEGAVKQLQFLLVA